MRHDDREAKLVWFGRGSDVVEYGRGCHGSGYGTPENPHAADPNRDDHNIPPGTPVIDKRPAIDAGPGVALAISGPMCNVDLEPGTVDRLCDTTDNLMASVMKAEPGNAFGDLIRGQERARDAGRKYGPLDTVDRETYIELWRAAGARIGHVDHGIDPENPSKLGFIWDDETEPAPEAEPVEYTDYHDTPNAATTD